MANYAGTLHLWRDGKMVLTFDTSVTDQVAEEVAAYITEAMAMWAPGKPVVLHGVDVVTHDWSSDRRLPPTEAR